MQNLLSTRFLEALEFAALAHEGQKRLQPDNVPYISHPYAVALILHRAGYPEDVIIAGLLHDIIEDTEYGADEIKERFGDHVLQLVSGVTEDKTLPYVERKEGYLVRLATGTPEVRAISAADLLANRMDSLLALQKGYMDFKKLTRKTPRQFFDDDYRRIEIIKHSVNNQITEELDLVMKKLEEYLANA
jgi:(p)ppGpp synthase/HD superfamily hydrolase